MFQNKKIKTKTKNTVHPNVSYKHDIATTKTGELNKHLHTLSLGLPPHFVR